MTSHSSGEGRILPVYVDLSTPTQKKMNTHERVSRVHINLGISKRFRQIGRIDSQRDYATIERFQIEIFFPIRSQNHRDAINRMHSCTLVRLTASRSTGDCVTAVLVLYQCLILGFESHRNPKRKRGASLAYASGYET